MKKEDFNRLKEICQKEGFYIEAFNGLFAIKEIDIWDGVEFAKDLRDNKIHLITNELTLIKDEYGRYCFRNEFIPSTESAYIEQLKKIAFEKFGEIKEGDRFKIYNDQIGEHLIDTRYNDNEFRYFKKTDSFCYGYLKLYEQGKWAEKLPESVKVEFDYSLYLTEKNEDGYYRLKYTFQINKNFSIFNKSCTEVGKFLAQQLETYLNKQL